MQPLLRRALLLALALLFGAGCSLLVDHSDLRFGEGGVSSTDAGRLDAGRLDAGRPTLDYDPSVVLQIVSGDSASCLLRNDGLVSCWGDNTFFQLGFDPTLPGSPGDCGPGSHCFAGELLNDPRVLVQATIGDDAPLTGVRALGAGKEHFCALIEGSGRVYCWGHDHLSQLGDREVTSNDRTHIARPVLREDGSPMTGALELAVGNSHACARTSSEVLCWGNNSACQLGTECGPDSSILTSDHARPVERLDALVGEHGAPSAIAAGGTTTCAILGEGSASVVVCWGELSWGIDGSRSNQFPTLVVDGETLPNPAPAGGVSQISVGRGFACALTLADEVHCWGTNLNGELGRSDNVELHRFPAPVLLGPDPGVTLAGVLEINAQHTHSCALRAGARPVCWGEGSGGQLGDGAAVSSNLAVEIAIDLPEPTSVSAGWSHTCALSSAQPFCWGSNRRGELAQGAISDTPSTPVPIAMPPAEM